jgi:hypothetical protein
VVVCVVIPCGVVDLPSILKMEAENYSEMVITIHKTARCQNPKDLHINFYCRVCVFYIFREIMLVCLKGFLKQREG